MFYYICNNNEPHYLVVPTNYSALCYNYALFINGINGTRQRSTREAIILRETVKIAEYLYRFYFRLIQYIIQYGVLFYDIKIHL